MTNVIGFPPVLLLSDPGQANTPILQTCVIESPWWNAAGKPDSYALRGFLDDKGFRQFQTIDDRTSKKTVVRNDGGILKVHDASSIKRWVREILEALPDEDFVDGGQLDVGADRYQVLSQFQNYSTDQLSKRVLSDLEIVSEAGFIDTEQIELGSDNREICHIRFKNGVVRITKDEIKIVPYEDLDTTQAVWESSIIPRNITIDAGSKGLFADFITLAMKRQNPTIKSDDWREEYVSTDASEQQLESLRTSYGYLIHTYNPPDTAKAIIYEDAGSDIGKKEGGNGKSLVMESIGRFKSYAYQDGKRFQKSGSLGARFQFTNVNVDTKFVFIDDINEDFSLESIFSMLTGDMEVEGKGTNKFVISRDRKPKFGITSNYVPAGTGTSFTRRVHSVEFGNYWNRCDRQNESPSDPRHLGKMLFDQFDDVDWNAFYNYGFGCVQEYLLKGLIAVQSSERDMKRLKISVEGTNGDGVVTAWMNEWVKKDRLTEEHHRGDGIPVDYLYQAFKTACFGYAGEDGGSWDFKRFDKAFFDFISLSVGYHYNDQLSYRGDSKMDRRWQKGPAGQQRPHVRVTTDFDVEWLEASPEVGIVSQDIPDEEDEELEAFRKLYEKP